MIDQNWAILPNVLKMLSSHALEPNPESNNQLNLEKNIRGKACIIDVTGVLLNTETKFAFVDATGYDSITAQVKEALQDPVVEKIILKINSPGGEVTGCSELSEFVRHASKHKECIAYVSGYGCSAAYWLASSCSRIIASNTSIVGSIGVMTAIYDPKIDGLYKFRSSQSPHKNAEPSSKKGSDEIQQGLDDLCEVFIDAVAKGRGVSVNEVRESYGKGSTFVGEKALCLGMVDQISSFNNFMEEELKTKEKPQSISGCGESNATSEPVYEQELEIRDHHATTSRIENNNSDGISTEILTSNPNTQKAQDLLSQVIAKERKRTLDILALAGSPEDSEKLISQGSSVGDAAIYIRKKELEARKHPRPKEDLPVLGTWFDFEDRMAQNVLNVPKSEEQTKTDLVKEMTAMANEGA